MRIETLKKLVDPEVRGQSMGYREMCQKPWQINFSGVEYTLATDGKAMVILKNATNDFMPLNGEGCARVLEFLQMPVRGIKTPLSKLKEFCGEAVWTRDEECGECGGTTVRCNGGDGCTCEFEEDDDGHDLPLTCEVCKDGKVSRMPFRVGKIGALPFNLAFVACLLETVTDDEVLVEVDEHRLIINGGGWRVWAMGLSMSFRPEKESEVPVLALQWEARPT